MSIKKMLENYSEKEIVQSFVLPVKLNKNAEREASDQLAKARAKIQALSSERDQLKARLLQLKFLLEDYIKSDEYDPDKRFGNFLKFYLDIIKKRRNEFAEEIAVHKTLITQLINHTREPNDRIAIRLELHSNNSIPAEYWYRLIQKDQVQQLKTNKELRQQEKKFVSNKVSVRL